MLNAAIKGVNLKNAMSFLSLDVSISSIGS